jgi:hypothetical protein
MKKSRLLGVLCAAVFAVITMPLHAAFVPAGLNPGDTYQLIFVTSGSRDATSNNIEVYNDFVNDQAALNSTVTGADIGVTYKAIASTGDLNTPLVNAIDNAPVLGPVYNMAGELIADDSADFWDGNINLPIQYNQFGAATSTNVWTGTYADGTPNGEFGLRFLGSYQSPLVGYSWLGADRWTVGGWTVKTDSYPFYAISSQLVVPNEVPVPAAVWLFGSGLLGLIGISRRKKAA